MTTDTDHVEARLAGELHNKDRYIARRDARWVEYVEALNALVRKRAELDAVVQRAMDAAAAYKEADVRWQMLQERVAYLELQLAERGTLNEADTRCLACGNIVEVHREGWLHDHTVSGELDDDLCAGSGTRNL